MSIFDEANKLLAEDSPRGTLSVRNHHVIPRLKAQREEFQERVNKINKLLGMLEKNPELVQIIDLSRELL